MSSDIMFNAALKFDFQPRYDQEYLTIEEQISIKLEMILIDKLLIGFKATKETIVDFDVELKFITDWIQRMLKMLNMFAMKNALGLQRMKIYC